MIRATVYKFQFLIGSLVTLNWIITQKEVFNVSIPYRQSSNFKCSNYSVISTWKFQFLIGSLVTKCFGNICSRILGVSIPYRQSSNCKQVFLVTHFCQVSIPYRQSSNLRRGLLRRGRSYVSIPYRQSSNGDEIADAIQLGKFQFLIGSLVTRDQEVFLLLRSTWFQFLIGSLVTGSVARGHGPVVGFNSLQVVQ